MSGGSAQRKNVSDLKLLGVIQSKLFQKLILKQRQNQQVISGIIACNALHDKNELADTDNEIKFSSAFSSAR